MKRLDKQLLLIASDPFNRSLDEIQILISKGADVNAKDAGLGGMTALHLVLFDDSEIAECLLQAGADANAKDDYGSTPLHVLCGAGGGEPDSYDDNLGYTFAALIKAGAAVDARNAAGNTPLHETYEDALADLLLRAGADVEARNKEGKLPSHPLCVQARTRARAKAKMKRELPQANKGDTANQRL